MADLSVDGMRTRAGVAAPATARLLLEVTPQHCGLLLNDKGANTPLSTVPYLSSDTDIPILGHPPVDRASFLRVGHSLFGLLFGTLGGLLAMRIHRSSEG